MFYLQKSTERKNFEAQYLKTAQNADRTLELQGGDMFDFLTRLDLKLEIDEQNGNW